MRRGKGSIRSGQHARDRAIEQFGRLRVWDTAENNGVLIYLLWAERDVEIVADRGTDAQVGAEAWETVRRQMEAAFRAGRFEEGAVAGIEAVGTLLARHFPGDGSGPNEVSDRPVILQALSIRPRITRVVRPGRMRGASRTGRAARVRTRRRYKQGRAAGRAAVTAPRDP